MQWKHLAIVVWMRINTQQREIDETAASIRSWVLSILFRSQTSVEGQPTQVANATMSTIWTTIISWCSTQRVQALKTLRECSLALKMHALTNSILHTFQLLTIKSRTCRILIRTASCTTWGCQPLPHLERFQRAPSRQMRTSCTHREVLALFNSKSMWSRRRTSRRIRDNLRNW